MDNPRRVDLGVRIRSGRASSLMRVAIGLVIVAYGALLLADNLHWAPAFVILDRWFAPSVLMIFGLAKLAQSCSASGRIFGGLLVAGGGLWMAEQALGLRFSIEHWWPLLIVALGVLFLVRAFDGGVGGAAFGPFGAGAETTTSAQASGLAFWSGIQRRVASAALSRAEFTAVMGGIEVDFRPATTANGRAVMDLFVFMGGVEVTVPPDWNVVNEAFVIMGGVDDRSSGGQGAANTLVIRGTILMGGVEIKT